MNSKIDKFEIALTILGITSVHVAGACTKGCSSSGWFCCQNFCSLVAVNILLWAYLYICWFSSNLLVEACKLTLPASQKLVMCWIWHSIALQVLSLAVLALNSSGWNSYVCPVFTLSLGMCSLQFWPTKIQGFPVTCFFFECWLGSW